MPESLPIPRQIVDFVLLGPADDQRQLQDSPLLGDVWLAYADKPASNRDLLITPHHDVTPGRVANAIVKGLKAVRGDGPSTRKERANVAYIQGVIAAKLFFGELLRVVVPLTWWWTRNGINKQFLDEYLQPGEQRDQIRTDVRECVTKIADAFDEARSEERRERLPFPAIQRYMALAGLILWAGRQEPTQDKPLPSDILAKAGEEADQIVDVVFDLLDQVREDWDSGWAEKFFRPKRGESAPVVFPVFQISMNRAATASLDKSIPAVKADAARALFGVDCAEITWAVVDSGIDQNHPAFMSNDGVDSRVVATFDFTRVRDVVSRDTFDDQAEAERIDRLRAGTRLTKAKAKKYLKQLAKEADEERPLNWDLVAEFLRLDNADTPTSHHGTHVAGIIGGAEVEDGGSAGMCPDIQLYDFRVLAQNLEETEFAVIAALQYIRYVNDSHDFIMIHGANLSLSIKHDVRNFACGRTPVCEESERLMESGVVVVAAAGNRGYQRFETQDGTFENYAAFSITDPGNADGVITVGSTHRYWPHTYGVSYFSSRGPTGDGRLKPDLVAPGERIEAPLPENSWGSESGTSMAAPHVSGAAAMLIARYPELAGEPRRIKQILCDSATDLGRERSFQGHGMLDVLRAFQSI